MKALALAVFASVAALAAAASASAAEWFPYKAEEVTPPFDPNGKITPMPNYRGISVYFDTKNGPHFIRLSGPAKTVSHNKKGFDNWLKGFK